MVELKILLDESGRVRVSGPIDKPDLCFELLDIAREGIKAETQRHLGVLVVAGPGEDLLALATRQ